MNPAELVTPSILDICKNSKSIVIAGFTKTGKVTIAKKISEELNIPLFISDNYIDENNRTNSLYVLMDSILPYYNMNLPFIVEGILAFRLLRKGIQLNNFHPDLIIKTNCNDATISHFYKKDGEENKIIRALGFNKGLDKIWVEYVNELNKNPFTKKPKYIELNTSLHGLR